MTNIPDLGGGEHERTDRMIVNFECTSIGPEYYIVFIWVIPTLEEIKEQVARFNINVARVRPEVEISFRVANHADYAYFTVVSQNSVDFFMRTL